MVKKMIVNFFTGYVFGDIATPQLADQARLRAVLIGAPLGMVVGAAFCWLGIW